MHEEESKAGDLTELRCKQEELSYLSGWGSAKVRSLIDRYGMAPDMAGRAKSRGGPRLYSIATVFAMAEARALVEEAGLTIAAACEAAGQGHGWLQRLVNGEAQIYSKYSGVLRPVGNDLNAMIPRRALVVVRPEHVWLEMRPRFMERYPAETAEFERKLSELHKLRAGGDE